MKAAFSTARRWARRSAAAAAGGGLAAYPPEPMTGFGGRRQVCQAKGRCPAAGGVSAGQSTAVCQDGCEAVVATSASAMSPAGPDCAVREQQAHTVLRTDCNPSNPANSRDEHSSATSRLCALRAGGLPGRNNAARGRSQRAGCAVLAQSKPDSETTTERLTTDRRHPNSYCNAV